MLLTATVAAGTVYGGALAAMYLLQGRLMYPGSEAAQTPSELGLKDVFEVFVKTDDGLSLRAWWRPPDAGRPVVLYFHGNAGPLHCRSNKFTAFGRAGYGLLMMAYRGYSGNEGLPRQATIVQDALAALGWLRGEIDAPVLYYGESLGSAVAMQLAQRIAPKAMVFEGAFDSAANLAQRRYPMFPSARLIRDRWDSLSLAPACPAPVLMIHGGLDRTVPIAHAERLFAALPEPKEFVRMDEAGHVDLFEHGGDAHVMRWLADHGY